MLPLAGGTPTLPALAADKEPMFELFMHSISGLARAWPRRVCPRWDKLRPSFLILALFDLLAMLSAPAATGNDRVTWRECLRQPSAWYAGLEAARVAENVLLYQHADGGWPKNIDMATELRPADLKTLVQAKTNVAESTIDNGSTYTQLRFLARVFAASHRESLQESFLRGLEFLLKSQYESGGWPQFPNRPGYYQHITFNDDAMVGVLRLLREVATGREPFTFVPELARSRAKRAVERGIDCMLKCQVVVRGRRTAWCAQHDERTLAPSPARSYELISLSGGETVGIVRFLMEVDQPSPAITQAIQSAITWLNEARLKGIRLERKVDAALPKGYDTIVVKDPAAPPLWARFYDLETGQPFFCGRDGVKKNTLAEIEHERRTGYAWYTSGPAVLLEKEYPIWKAKWVKSGE